MQIQAMELTKVTGQRACLMGIMSHQMALSFFQDIQNSTVKFKQDVFLYMIHGIYNFFCFILSY